MINHVPPASWTIEVEGSKRVDLAGKDDKRQITACFAGTMEGDFLPPQLVYEGKTPRCLPQVDFPDGWHVTIQVLTGATHSFLFEVEFTWI